MGEPAQKLEHQEGKGPEGTERQELTIAEVESIPAQMADRAGAAVSEIQKRGQKALVDANEQERGKLISFDSRAKESQKKLLQQLESARQRLHSAQEATEKVQFWDRKGIAKAEKELQSAQENYDALMEEHGNTKVGKMVRSRKDLVQQERATAKRKSLFRHTHDRLTKENWQVVLEAEEGQEALEGAREQYEIERAEIVAGNIETMLAEQMALVDERAVAEHEGSMQLYKLHKQLGDHNLAHALGWEPKSWYGKIIGKGISARMAVNISLVAGSTLMAGAGAGIGAAAGAMLLTRRLMAGAGAAAGSFDMLRMRRSAKIEKEVGEKDLSLLTLEELLLDAAALESQAAVNGKRIHQNETYRLLQEQIGQRLEQERDEDTTADIMQEQLAILMHETDQRFLDAEKEDKKALERYRVYGAAFGIFVGSGVFSKIVKIGGEYALKGGSHIAKAALDVLIPTAQAHEIPEDIVIPEANIQQPVGQNIQSSVEASVEPLRVVTEDLFKKDHSAIIRYIESNAETRTFGAQKMLHVEGGTFYIRNGELSFESANGSQINIDEAADLKKIPDIERYTGSHTAEPPQQSTIIEESVPASSEINDRVAEIHSETGDGGEIATGELFDPDGDLDLTLGEHWNSDQIQAFGSAKTFIFHANGRELVMSADTGYKIEFPDNGFHRFNQNFVYGNYEELARKMIDQYDNSTSPQFADQGFIMSMKNDLGRLSEMAEVADSLEQNGLKNSEQYAALAQQMDEHVQQMVRDYGNIFSPRFMEQPGIPDGLQRPEATAAALQAQDAGFSRDASIAHTAAMAEGRRVTGLYEEEWERSVQRTGRITPGNIIDRMREGVRRADDTIGRGLDVGAYETQSAIDRGLGRLEDAPKPQAQDSLPHYDPNATPAERLTARQQFSEARQDLRDDARTTAEHFAEAQEVVRETAADVNPEALAALEATGNIKVESSGAAVHFENVRGQRWAVRIDFTVDAETSTRELLGDDYKEVIQRTTGEKTIQAANPEIQVIQQETSRLASLLDVRDQMLSDGLHETDQFRALEKVIERQVRQVNQYGRVLWDDPKYGQIPGRQIVGSFISLKDEGPRGPERIPVPRAPAGIDRMTKPEFRVRIPKIEDLAEISEASDAVTTPSTDEVRTIGTKSVPSREGIESVEPETEKFEIEQAVTSAEGVTPLEVTAGRIRGIFERGPTGKISMRLRGNIDPQVARAEILSDNYRGSLLESGKSSGQITALESKANTLYGYKALLAQMETTGQTGKPEYSFLQRAISEIEAGIERDYPGTLRVEE